MRKSPSNPRRSVLYVPATNAKALAKLADLGCDAVIIDLEDAVAPDAKAQSRASIKQALQAAKSNRRPEIVIRINALTTEWGRDDLLAALECSPDAVLVPKVETPRDLLEVNDLLDDDDPTSPIQLWAMVETPRALLNLGSIAELGRDRGARLTCLVAGTNDLAMETGVKMTPDRRYLTAWLQQMVLAARAGGIDVLDGVANDFRNLDAFVRECEQGAAMGFDGKTLIHPSQIAPCNTAFSPSAEDVARAHAVVKAFDLPQNAGKGVISVEGRMTERLHLAQARRLLDSAGDPE